MPAPALHSAPLEDKAAARAEAEWLWGSRGGKCGPSALARSAQQTGDISSRPRSYLRLFASTSRPSTPRSGAMAMAPEV